MDALRLKDSFAKIAMHGDEVPLFFYSDLFIRHPEVRELFPISMKSQRDHLMVALGRIVSQVDRADDLSVFLIGLGRDHRKFGAVAEHYESVRDSLLATIAHFSGDAWTPELATDWTSAYSRIADIMIEGCQRGRGDQARVLAGNGRLVRAQGLRYFGAASQPKAYA